MFSGTVEASLTEYWKTNSFATSGGHKGKIHPSLNSGSVQMCQKSEDLAGVIVFLLLFLLLLLIVKKRKLNIFVILSMFMYFLNQNLSKCE